MANYETTVPSSWDHRRTFDYLADFRNVAEWDPSISKVSLQSGTPGAVGAVYDVTMKAVGREMTIPYTAIEVQQPDRIRMRGETDALVSLDTITVANGAERVEVNYRAELELKGARKLADPVAELVLHRASDKARDGLERKLAS